MIYVGFLFIALAIIINLTAIIWQLVEAFKTNTAWGVISILGWFLGGLPNLIWCFVYFDRGWRVLVAGIGNIIPAIVGVLIVASEASIMAIGA